MSVKGPPRFDRISKLQDEEAKNKIIDEDIFEFFTGSVVARLPYLYCPRLLAPLLYKFLVYLQHINTTRVITFVANAYFRNLFTVSVLVYWYFYDGKKSCVISRVYQADK